jgi:hypothetical protein
VDILKEDAMAVQDGEKGGKDLLVTTAGYAVAGERGINIKIFTCLQSSTAADEKSESQFLTRPVFLALSTV